MPDSPSSHGETGPDPLSQLLAWGELDEPGGTESAHVPGDNGDRQASTGADSASASDVDPAEGTVDEPTSQLPGVQQGQGLVPSNGGVEAPGEMVAEPGSDKPPPPEQQAPGGVEQKGTSWSSYGQIPYVQQGYGPVRYDLPTWTAPEPGQTQWSYEWDRTEPSVLRPPKRPPRTLPGWLGVVLIAAVLGAVVGGGVVALVASRAPRTIVREYFPFKAGKVQVGDIQSVLASVLPAVVSIDTSDIRGVAGGGFVQGAGTGMIIEPSGVILTNNHVIAGAQTVTVTFYGQTKRFPAKVIGGEPQKDIALVQVEGAGDSLPVVHLGNSDAAQQGDAVLAIGNALALAGGETVTEGIVSALNRSLTATTDAGTTENLSGLIQTDAPINPGNSGGPLVNASGEVVAMNTAVATSSQGNAPAQNVGFAIAVDEIRTVVEQILHHPIRP